MKKTTLQFSSLFTFKLALPLIFGGFLLLSSLKSYSQSISACTGDIPFGPIMEDASISSWSPNNNYGSDPDIKAFAWTTGGLPTNVRSLFNFPLSAFPFNTLNALSPNSNTKIFLTLHIDNSSFYASNGANDLLIQRVTSIWEENTVTWATQPSTTTLHQITIPSGSSYIDIDITQLVSDMFDDFILHQVPPAGFMLRLVNETAYRSAAFGSGDNADPTLWPTIKICTDVALRPSQDNTDESAMKKLVNGCSVSTNSDNKNNTLNYSVANDAPVSIELYSMTGQKVSVLMNDVMKTTGNYSYEINSSGLNLAPGMYLSKLQIGSDQFINKIIQH